MLEILTLSKAMAYSVDRTGVAKLLPKGAKVGQSGLPFGKITLTLLMSYSVIAVLREMDSDSGETPWSYSNARRIVLTVRLLRLRKREREPAGTGCSER